MKKVTTLAFGLFLTASTLFGQAKRYVLLEHFTNTLCSSCASQNPSFFTTINVETNPDVHHISYHWRTPYQNCVYYQDNKIPQDARADYYSVPGSPRVSSNGGAQTSLSAVTQATIAAAATTSPLSIRVSEATNANQSRTVSVRVKTVGSVPTSSYRLHVALVEKKTTYVSPNGEREHFNVFRQFLTATDGNSITLSANEQTIFFDYAPNLATSAQLYAVAWVQNMSNKEVLNSATRFDAATSTDDISVDNQVTASPNPTTGKVTLMFDKLTPQYLTVQNTSGQIIENVKLSKSANYELNLTNLAAGVYIVKVKSEEGIAVKRVVKN